MMLMVAVVLRELKLDQLIKATIDLLFLTRNQLEMVIFSLVGALIEMLYQHLLVQVILLFYMTHSLNEHYMQYGKAHHAIL